MTRKRIFLTGASGCIGHYISESLINNTDHELYLLVRNPQKLQVNTQVRPHIHVLQGDMKNIEQFTDLLKTIDIAILTATAWGGDDTFDINVTKTEKLLQLLDPDTCEHVIYFSTASIVDRQSQLLKEAGEIGTDYIRSKHDCLADLNKLELAAKTTVLLPTLVFGGEVNKPYSHISSGLGEVTKYMSIIRFLKADGSFHFIHGKDIAEVVRYFVAHPPQRNQPELFVLGQAPLTVNQTVAAVCKYLRKKIYFQIPLSFTLADIIIFIFRIQMAAWDRFSMNYRHFTYDKYINPGSLGLPNYCATMHDVLQIHGIKPGK